MLLPRLKSVRLINSDSQPCAYKYVLPAWFGFPDPNCVFAQKLCTMCGRELKALKLKLSFSLSFSSSRLLSFWANVSPSSHWKWCRGKVFRRQLACLEGCWLQKNEQPRSHTVSYAADMTALPCSVWNWLFWTLKWHMRFIDRSQMWRSDRVVVCEYLCLQLYLKNLVNYWTDLNENLQKVITRFKFTACFWLPWLLNRPV